VDPGQGNRTSNLFSLCLLIAGSLLLQIYTFPVGTNPALTGPLAFNSESNLETSFGSNGYSYWTFNLNTGSTSRVQWNFGSNPYLTVRSGFVIVLVVFSISFLLLRIGQCVPWRRSHVPVHIDPSRIAHRDGHWSRRFSDFHVCRRYFYLPPSSGSCVSDVARMDSATSIDRYHVVFSSWGYGGSFGYVSVCAEHVRHDWVSPVVSQMNNTMTSYDVSQGTHLACDNVCTVSAGQTAILQAPVVRRICVLCVCA
jgi:hypothetical protein